MIVSIKTSNLINMYSVTHIISKGSHSPLSNELCGLHCTSQSKECSLVPTEISM